MLIWSDDRGTPTNVFFLTNVKCIRTDVFVQTNLSKQYRPRSDAAELFATHPAILYIFIG